MNIYFDTEFTGLKKDTTLVSLGMVAEDGETFYAEFTDYDKSYKDDWFQRNVLDNLLLSSNKANTNQKVADVQVLGTKSHIQIELTKWLTKKSNGGNDIVLVSDVCHYDMVLFADIFGSAQRLPVFVTPACHDINQDIARHFGLSMKDSFDLSREVALDCFGNKEIPGEKHNALYDAKVIKGIYEGIKRIENR